jgi:hypothetical protein
MKKAQSTEHRAQSLKTAKKRDIPAPCSLLPARSLPAPCSSLPQRLKKATAPSMIEVAPGRFVPTNELEIPEVSLCTWKPFVDGTYSPVPQRERFIKLSSKVAKLLGVESRNLGPLYRLSRMGCIEVIQAAPRLHLINLTSWYNHLRRCAEDPEFWEEGRGYIEEYRKTLS